MFIGKFITNYMQLTDRSQSDVARILNTTRGTVSNYITGKREPEPNIGYTIMRRLNATDDEISDYIVYILTHDEKGKIDTELPKELIMGTKDKLEEKYKEQEKKQKNKDEIEFLNISINHKKEKIPVYELPVAAGVGGAFEDNHIEGYMKPLDYDFIVRVKGRSMEPLIPDGFLAAVAKTDSIIPDKPLLVKYQIEPGVYLHAIKFVKKTNGSCELTSANPEFKNIIPCEYIEVLGVVVGTFKGF